MLIKYNSIKRYYSKIDFFQRIISFYFTFFANFATSLLVFHPDAPVILVLLIIQPDYLVKQHPLSNNSILSRRLLQHWFYKSYFNVGLIGGKLWFTPR